ncbi:MAG TPA: GNAT family N-acetyltransferase [Bryobacteraceae bacterium]|nr:GNAT family N-acetyltransferase [Bryobacteraceae bacterium]
MSIEQKRLVPAASALEYQQLFRDCFPETAGTPLETHEHYLWKYGAVGKAGPAFEFGAYEDARLVGYYAALPFTYHVSGSPRIACMVCDVMTDSRMRGQGIFTMQGRYATEIMAKEGVSFVTGYPIRPSVLPGHFKVGWKVAFELPVYFKLLDPTTLLASRGLSFLVPVLRPLCAIYQAVARALTSGDDGGVCRQYAPEEFFELPEYEMFLKAWSPQYEIYLVRAADFFRWRLGAPAASYRILAQYHGRDLTGLAVVRNSTINNLDVTAIVDLMILPERASAAGALHREVERFARESRTGGVVIMTTRPDAARWRLCRYGFLKSPIKFKLILKWLSEAPVPSAFWRAEAWHLSWTDTDNL